MQPTELSAAIASLRAGAKYGGQIEGATHQFYRYPARFSPQFARAAIEAFSRPNDLVLDPFMGGGTTVVEALLSGRRCIGNDLNSLAVFLAAVKTTPLTVSEIADVRNWATHSLPRLRYTDRLNGGQSWLESGQMRNMQIPRARPIKKMIALSLESLSGVESETARRFARCSILNAGQWALNGRKRSVSANDFRDFLSFTAGRMLRSLEDFAASLPRNSLPAALIEGSAETVARSETIMASGPADLIVTSPPYPGIHLLYHRWQVDGRKETPAPYWIAGCLDGKGAAYYNIADRRDKGASKYFDGIGTTFSSLKSAIKSGGYVVQLLAFASPRTHLRRYLATMEAAGYHEVRPDDGSRRIWRGVPRRTWHATSNGQTSSSREVVLVHRAE